MKTTLRTAPVLAAALGLAAALVAVAATDPGMPPAALPAPVPELVADAPDQACGEVRTGPTLVRAFTVANRHPADTFTVTGFATPCGCLGAESDAATLAPGASARVTLRVNTLTQAAGAQSWRGTLRYRRAGPPSVTPDSELAWSVTATLVPELTLTPPALALSTATEATQTITLTDRRATPRRVLGAASSSPHLTVTVGATTPLPAGGAATALTARLLATCPAGTSDETIVIATDDPACPELRLPVRVAKRAAQAVVATPESAAVRFAPGQAEASALVLLRSPQQVPIQIAKAEADPAAGVRLRFGPDAGPTAAVRVTVTADAPPTGSATVTITLAQPAGEVVTVPVTWSKPGG